MVGDGSKSSIAFGPFVLDRGDERLVGPEGPIRIGHRAFCLLCVLIDRRGALLTKDQLFDSVWGNVIVSEATLTSVIKELRRALGDDAKQPRYVRSIYGRGYRFIAEVRPVDRPADSGPADPGPAERPPRQVEPAGAGSPSPALPGPPLAGTGHWKRRTVLGIGLAMGTAAAVAGLRRDWGDKPASAVAPPFVVVLPFEDRSADHAASFLAVALPRDIRDQLSRVAGLRIIAEDSSRTTADQDLSPRSMGTRLGARFVVSGAVGESGGRLNGTVRIFDLASDREVLAQSGKWDAADLYAMQQELSATILREILGRVSTAMTMPPRPRVPRDPRAYRLVLEGQDFLERSRAARMVGDEAGGRLAGDSAYRAANDALAIDPNDPGALLLIAQLIRNGWTSALAGQNLTSQQRAANAITYVDRALSVDPNDPAALTALGDYYRRFQWRWAEAETLFRKALMLSPSFIEAHWSFAYMLGTIGRAVEGLRHAQIVFKLDPESLWHRIALPRLLCVVGDRGNMFRRYDIELSATPGNIFLIKEIYTVHLCDGDAFALDRLAARVRTLHAGAKLPEAAARLLERITAAAAALRGDSAAYVAAIDADVRAYDDAASATNQASHGRLSVDLLFLCGLEYAWAGQTDKSLALLARALAGHSLYWPAAAPYGVAPLPASRRADPRYDALWNREPRTRAYLTLRRQALLDRQMAGYFPDGRFARPSPEEINRSIDAV
ncbi:MAG TPA: winged helix-turn-helix domain-containing protein [Novosphingobium sp.]|nr:winged helix-turn-helix domain-containing protein [Novosphingobium sp.]